jgi:hypothetical protein
VIRGKLRKTFYGYSLQLFNVVDGEEKYFQSVTMTELELVPPPIPLEGKAKEEFTGLEKYFKGETENERET